MVIPSHLTLSGDERVLARLRLALEAEGDRLFPPDGTEPPLWVHAGSAAGRPPGLAGRGLLIAPRIGAEELALLAAGSADVALDTASGEEMVARLAALRGRPGPLQNAIEDELRRTRDFLEHLVDGSSDAIVAADMRGRLLVFNRAAERLFGRTADEARAGLNVIELYAQGGAREMMRLLREAPGGRIEAVRSYAKTQAGELVPIEVSASVIRMNGGEHATVGLLRDLRERVRVESELARTRSRLVEAEKQAALTALAGGAAHELNQPLTVILGYVDLLRRKAHPRDQHALEAIGQQAERMAESVRQIAQLTHLETQAYPGEKVIADLEKSSERRPP